MRTRSARTRWSVLLVVLAVSGVMILMLSGSVAAQEGEISVEASTNAPVTEGEELVVDANLLCSEEGACDQEVTLLIDGAIQDSVPVNLDAGETDLVTLTWQTQAGDAGDYDWTVEPDVGTAATGSFSVIEPAISSLSDLDIAGQGADATITEGEFGSVDVNLTNTGGQAGQFDVTLEIGDEVELTQTIFEVGAGQTVTMTFEAVTSDLPPGDYPVVVSTEDDTITGSLTVEALPEANLSNLDIAGQGEDATITEGDDEPISVDVTNIGDQTGSFSVELSIGGDFVAGTGFFELAGGETTSVTFEGHTDDLEGGEYAVDLSAIEGEALQDEISGSLTVETQAESELSNLEIAPDSATVTQRDEVPVNVDVTNIGDQTGTFDVTLQFNADEMETVSVTLAGGETETVSFEPLSGLPSGEHLIGVTTADDGLFGGLFVQPAPVSELSTLDIVDQGADATILETTGGDVAVDVTNIGDESGSFEVTLDIGEEETGFHTTDTLDPDETETVRFENVTADLAPGEYPVVVTTIDDDIGGTLTVEAPAESALSALDIAGQGVDATITRGTVEDVAVDVTNVGDASGSFELTLEIGTQRTETQSTGVIDGGETETVVFPFVTSAIRSGEHSVDIVTADDDIAGSLTVQSPAQSAVSDLDIAGQGSEANLTRGQNESLSVTVENVGDISGQFGVTLTVGTETQLTRTTGTLSGGEAETISFENVTGGLALGAYDVDVETADDATSGSLTVLEPEIELSDLQIAESGSSAVIAVGNTADVTANLTNTGESDGLVDVTLDIVANDGTSVVEEQQEAVAVGAGETVTAAFNETGPFELGIYTVTVATDNASISGTLTVGTAPEAALSDLDIAGQGSQAEIQEGADESIAVDVRNVGDVAGTFTVSLAVEDDTGDEVATGTQTVTLNGSVTETVVFETVTGAFTQGEYDVVMTTAGDSVTGELSVSLLEESELSNLNIHSQGSSASIVEGTDGDISVDVTNVGEVESSFAVTLSLGDQVEQTEQTSELGVGETETITFAGATTGLDLGEHEVLVTTDDDGISRVGDTETGALGVFERPTFTVNSVSALGEVEEGETVEIEAEISNTGTVTDTQSITLVHDGTELGTTSLTLDGGVTETVLFEVDTDELGAGEFSPEVQSESDSNSVTIQILQIDTGDGLLPVDALYLVLLLLLLLLAAAGYYYVRRRRLLEQRK